MMYTALDGYDKGYTFAAVHDSFWTHAGDTEDLGKILRDKFIQLHTQPGKLGLLEELELNLKQRYPKANFEEIPARGDFDMNKVRESDYFFA